MWSCWPTACPAALIILSSQSSHTLIPSRRHHQHRCLQHHCYLLSGALTFFREWLMIFIIGPESDICVVLSLSTSLYWTCWCFLIHATSGYLFTSDSMDRQVDHRMYRVIWVAVDFWGGEGWASACRNLSKIHATSSCVIHHQKLFDLRSSNETCWNWYVDLLKLL